MIERDCTDWQWPSSRPSSRGPQSRRAALPRRPETQTDTMRAALDALSSRSAAVGPSEDSDIDDLPAAEDEDEETTVMEAPTAEA